MYDNKNGCINFGGKTDSAMIDERLLTVLKELFPKNKFKLYDQSMCLYGEGYGPGIDKGSGKYTNGKGHGFVLFDVLVDGKWWLERKNVEDVAKKLDIGVVPIIGKGNLDEAVTFVKNEITSKWGDFLAEGIVVKPKIELFTRAGKRIITKIKHTDF